MINLDSGDLFEMSALTGYVNNVPYIPSAAGALFSSTGIATTTAVLDARDGSVELIADRARAAAPAQQGLEGRQSVAVVTKHFALEKTISAEEFQNIRVFGSDSQLDTIETVRNRYLDDMVKAHQLTLEHQRVDAIKGMLTNSATGDIDLHTAFGAMPEEVEFNLSTNSTKVRNRVMDAVEASEDAMGADMVSGYVAFVGKEFFRSLVEHSNVKSAYERWQDGAALRDDMRMSFVFAGVEFVSYRGKVNGAPLIADDEGFLCPKADIYKTVFAPGSFIETANTIGLPQYAKAHMDDYGRGIKMLVESNPVSFVTRPASVIKLHKDTASSI